MNARLWLNTIIALLSVSNVQGQEVSSPPPCEGVPKPISRKPIYEGATYSKVLLSNGYGGCAYFVTIDPTKSIFRVLASGAGKPPRTLYLGDYIGKNANIVLSGGYMSSFSPPKALGLVKINGRQISAPHPTWLGKGMMCTDGRMPKIAKYDELKSTSLPDCLQSGPLLIEGGKVRYPNPDIDVGEDKLVKSEQNQAFICVDANHEIKLGVSDPIKLDDFSDFLKEKLNCKDALRLTGHFTAGLQIGRVVHGSDEYPLPSVIAVAPKATP